MFDNRWDLKWYFTVVVFALALAVIFNDFDEFVSPSWLGLPEDFDPPSGPLHGVKADLLAMCAGAMLFVSMIPIGSSRSSKLVDKIAQSLGGFLALGTGWYWLLSESDGDPRRYLIAYLPMAVLMTIAFTVNVLVGSASVSQEQREQSEPSWRLTILFGIGLMVAVAVITLVALKSRSLP